MSFYTHDNTVDSPLNNFGTFNPLNKQEGSPVYSNGNLLAQDTGNNMSNVPVTCHFPRIEGCKWYAEFYYYEGFYDNGAAGAPMCFIVTSDEKDSALGIYSTSGPEYFAGSKNSWSQYRANNNTMPSHSYPVTVNYGIVGILFDYELNKIQFSINGNWCSEIFPMDSNAVISGINLSGKYNLSGSDSLYVRVFHGSGDRYKVAMNCGQDHTFGGAKTGGGAYTDANGIGQFYYEPPEGALSLCTANIPSGPINIANDDVPADYMKAVTWTGDSQNPRSITVGFQPDLIIAKRRNAAGSNWAIDSLRGKQRMLSTDTANSEDVNSVNGSVESFDLDGFSLKGTNTNGNLNNSGYTHVAWCWKAAGSPADNQARIIDTDGSLITKTTADLKTEAGASITPSKVSANRKSGFSIVKYNGTGSAATVPHGLSATPELIITKGLTTSYNWNVCTSLAPDSYLELNTTSAKNSNSSRYISAGINKNTLTSYVQFNQSGVSHIAYCWHSVPGYSKFGSYVGTNSADGPYVECGFRPAWLMVKRTDSTSAWVIQDTVRSEYNPVDAHLLANVANNESTGLLVDYLSGGFKIRVGSPYTDYNASGSTFIFAAFAEVPFNAPSNAR